MTDTAELFIDSRCELGEGPFWHPFQERLFWFDILNKTLFSATEGGIMIDRFTFDAPVSAAGVIDADNLGIASAAGIFRLHLPTDTREVVAPLAADSTVVRTNDGRVNPAGGLWIGTMGLKNPGKVAAGSLYQVRAGQVTTILTDQHIPNATCFSPDGRTAYYSDNVTKIIRKVPIDPETGLPNGDWSEYARIEGPGGPDGSVIDAEGFMWNAEFGNGRVVRRDLNGRVVRTVTVPVSQPTCPSFGDLNLKTLYVTSARENMSAEKLAAEPHAGGVFAIELDVPGLPENLFTA